VQTDVGVVFHSYATLYTAASTSLALLSAITPRKPLRESDVFQINNVSATNYRMWRGPAFWAQLTTLIMDMLITSLIAIEVRVLFVLQQQQQLITTTCSTRDNETRVQSVQSRESIIVNPFFRATNTTEASNRLNRTDSDRHGTQANLQHEIQETSMSVQITRPKVVASSASTNALSSDEYSPSSSQSNTSRYVNSKEVRQLKKLMLRNHKEDKSTRDSPLVSMVSGATSYCNPMFSENDTESTSNC